MFLFFTIIHVLLCVFMIFVILLQPGKDAGMGAALGGGSSQTAFGGRGAVTLLGKITAFCAIAYFLTSLGLSFVGLKQSVVAGLVEETKTAAVAVVDAGIGAAPAAAPTEAPKAAEGGLQQGNPEAAPGKAAAPTEDKPSVNDGVPSEKLPEQK